VREREALIKKMREESQAQIWGELVAKEHVPFLVVWRVRAFCLFPSAIQFLLIPFGWLALFP